VKPEEPGSFKPAQRDPPRKMNLSVQLLGDSLQLQVGKSAKSKKIVSFKRRVSAEHQHGVESGDRLFHRHREHPAKTTPRKRIPEVSR